MATLPRNKRAAPDAARSVSLPYGAASRRKVKIGRPTAAETDRLDRTILDMATAVFLSRGYPEASMDAVAVAARVSKKTLYARYANKAELFEAVVESRLAVWSAQETARNKLAGRTLEQRLRNHLTRVVNWAATQEVRAFEQLVATAPPEIAQNLHQARFGPVIDFLASEIDEYTRAEGKPARNPQGVASDLMTFVAGWFYIKANLGPIPVAEATAFANHAVELLFAARESW